MANGAPIPITLSIDDITTIVKDAVQQAIQQTGQQNVQQTSQQASTQDSLQIAQQIAEQVSQGISQAISKVMQTQTETTGGSSVSAKTVLGEIAGGTERIEKDQLGESGLLFANSKRTYDEYQSVSLDAIGKNRAHFDKLISDAQSADGRTRDISIQALQNAVETANMVSKNALDGCNLANKQSIAHRDIAINTEWDTAAEVQATIITALTSPGVVQAMSVALATAMASITKNAAPATA